MNNLISKSFKWLSAAIFFLPVFVSAQDAFVDADGNLMVEGRMILRPGGSFSEGNLILDGVTFEKPVAVVLADGSLQVGEVNLPVPVAAEVYCPPVGHLDDAILHWVYNFEDCWALWYADYAAGDWGYIYVGERQMDGYGWLYHLTQGWIYLHSGTVHSLAMIYSPDLGWIAAYESAGAGQFWRYDTSEFLTWK